MIQGDYTMHTLAYVENEQYLHNIKYNSIEGLKVGIVVCNKLGTCLARCPKRTLLLLRTTQKVTWPIVDTVSEKIFVALKSLKRENYHGYVVVGELFVVAVE